MVELLVAGMMSGTSVDGIDCCLVKIEKNWKWEIVGSASYPFPAQLQENILCLAEGRGNTALISEVNAELAKSYAACIAALPQRPELIANHGQTVWHSPGKNSLQIGDISMLCQFTQCPVVGDFRPADIAAGGQGAPLVPFADKIIFGTEIPRAIQNIGGIGNVTILAPDTEPFAFDTGPGNMLIDRFCQFFYGEAFDWNGLHAAAGTVDEKALNRLLSHPFYQDKPPKSTGRELYNSEYCREIVTFLPKDPDDCLAKLTQLTATTIALAQKKFVLPRIQLREMVLCGGGANNLTLRRMLAEALPDLSFHTAADFGIAPHLKEALSFALLGYAALFGIPNNIPGCTGASYPVVMGKFAFPAGVQPFFEKLKPQGNIQL